MGTERIYEPLKAFLRLPVNIGKISVQLALHQHCGVAGFPVFFRCDLERLHELLDELSDEDREFLMTCFAYENDYN